MNIDLPKTFSMTIQNRKIAYIENNTLILKMARDWEKVAYEITYQMKGREICSYCGKKIQPNQLSLDHQYARALGGPTIPNNLVPACCTCNNEKAGMNEKQYRNYRKLNEEQKVQFRRDVEDYYHFVKKWEHFAIPEEWVEEILLSQIKLDYPYHNRKMKTQRHYLQKYYEKYQSLPRPILLDRNKVLLDDYLIYQKAKEQEIKSVSVIILENVIVQDLEF